MDRFKPGPDDSWVDAEDSWFDQFEISSSGSLEVFGNNNPSIVIPTGDGSLDLFGATAIDVKVDYDESTNKFSILYKQADISDAVCAKESASFPLAFALENKRPFKRFHSQDLTETQIDFNLSFQSNTITLGNVNFNEVIIENVGLQDSFYAIEDADTGVYNIHIRTELDDGFFSSKIIIPAQSTLNGESFFAIGSIIPGTRAEVVPKFNITKKPAEQSRSMEFDNNNPGLSKSGRTYHEFDLQFRIFDNDDVNTFEDIVYFSKGMTMVVHEIFPQYESVFLVQRKGDFKYNQIDTDVHDIVLSFRGLN